MRIAQKCNAFNRTVNCTVLSIFHMKIIELELLECCFSLRIVEKTQNLLSIPENTKWGDRKVLETALNQGTMNRFLLVLPKNTSQAHNTHNKKRHLQSSPADATTDNNSVKVSSASDTTQVSKRRKLVQHFLDIGQKDFGVPTTCPKCKLLYVADDEEDIQRHRKYCAQIDRPPVIALRTFLQGEKPLFEREIQNVNYRIIQIPETSIKILNELKSKVYPTVEADMETSPEFFENKDDNYWRTFLVVRGAGEVIGLSILETITQQMVRTISITDELSTLENQHGTSTKDAQERSDSISSDYVGVRVIWIHSQYRRQQWARLLLDNARASFSFGQVIDKQKLAFSQPTSLGLTFAKGYIHENNTAAEPDLSVPCYI